MTAIDCVVVEDEPLALATVVDQLAELPWLRVIAEARDGVQAVTAIDSLRPDLVFLDVQLPELTGLEVLERIRHDPAIVFVTAYDEYAVTAFELGAVDYLLKPYSRDRLALTMERVRRTLPWRPGSATRARDALLANPLHRLFARTPAGIFPIDVADIRRIQSDGDYVEVHTAGRSFLLHLTLREVEARLDPGEFVRVHRSHIIGLRHVRSLRPASDRRLRVELDTGDEIVASRSGSKRLRALTSGC